MARAGVGGRTVDDEDIGERQGIGAFFFSILRESPRDSLAVVVAAGATGAILINALFMLGLSHSLSVILSTRRRTPIKLAPYESGMPVLGDARERFFAQLSRKL